MVGFALVKEVILSLRISPFTFIRTKIYKMLPLASLSQIQNVKIKYQIFLAMATSGVFWVEKSEIGFKNTYTSSLTNVFIGSQLVKIRKYK